MISQLTKKCNYLTQKIYDRFIQSVDFTKSICKCGAVGNFHKHGYYTRSVKNPENKVKITILRVKCNSCGKTHAVMHPSIVPYSQILLNDTINIILTYEDKLSPESILNQNPEITESDVRYTIKKYLKHWRDRILSIMHVSIHDFFKLENFQINVSDSFNLAFMQIKRCFYKTV